MIGEQNATASEQKEKEEGWEVTSEHDDEAQAFRDLKKMSDHYAVSFHIDYDESDGSWYVHTTSPAKEERVHSGKCFSLRSAFFSVFNDFLKKDKRVL